MKNKSLSTPLCNTDVKSLSGRDLLISEAKRHVFEMKRAIRQFEDLRDSGMEFPETTSGSENKDLSQKEDLGQSRSAGLCLKSRDSE